MDELNEEARNLLQKILINGYVPLDSLSPEERKVMAELLRGNYLRIYIGVNGKRLGNILRLLNDQTITLKRSTYNCNKYVLAFSLITLPLLYLSARAFIMGFVGIGFFFILISGVVMVIIYYVVNRWCINTIRALNTVLNAFKSLRS